MDQRKTVFITGCSPGGIGHSMALEFHNAGLHVIATARSANTLSSLAKLGISTLSLTVDSEESVQKCFQELRELLGPDRGLDYLVHNAGRNYTVPALDVDMAEVRNTFETNLFAVIRITQLFAPLVIQAQGTIVMIASLASVVPMVFGSVYNASKAALKQYADTLRLELAPFDVRVISIITGGVKSRIARNAIPLPSHSLYRPIEEDFKRRQVYSQHEGIPHEQYAKSVVAQVMKGAGPYPWRWFMKDARKRWIWEGGKSWFVWFMCGGWSWSLVALADLWFSTLFNLGKLRKVKPE